MHTEKDYSFTNYRKIKFSRHNFMLKFISILYVVMQTITVGKMTSNEYGYVAIYLIVGFAFATIVGIAVYMLRYQLDYAIYKMLFSRTQNRRYYYTHSTLTGSLFIYLIVFGLGVVGILFLLLCSRPGQDYREFKEAVLTLNQNYQEINMLINEILSDNGSLDYEETIGFIKYRINMYNLYEMALFDEQATMIEYEQLVANIRK